MELSSPEGGGNPHSSSCRTSCATHARRRWRAMLRVVARQVQGLIGWRTWWPSRRCVWAARRRPQGRGRRRGGGGTAGAGRCGQAHPKRRRPSTCGCASSCRTGRASRYPRGLRPGRSRGACRGPKLRPSSFCFSSAMQPRGSFFVSCVDATSNGFSLRVVALLLSRREGSTESDCVAHVHSPRTRAKAFASEGAFAT